MKNFYAAFFIIIMLTGCSLDNSIPFEEEAEIAEENDHTGNVRKDPLENYSKLDENTKNQLRELYKLWGEFYDGIRPDVDPSEDFHNSEYLAELKNFLSQKESLAASNELDLILAQPSFKAIDKTIILSNGEEYGIRVIRYIADYETPITSHTLVPTKFAFVQCWNDEAFYFNTLSDGDAYSTVHDFFPLEIDGAPHIILTGTTFPFYPHTPFLWAWRLEEDGFRQSDAFDFKTVETDKYFILDSVDLDNSRCLFKWTFQTDGSFIIAERRMDYGIEMFSDYLHVVCDVSEDGKIFQFTASDNLGKEIEPAIKISLVNGRFVIE